jgi:alpha-L-fucosidase 2
LDAAAKLGFELLRNRHVEAHQKLFGRVELQLAETPNGSWTNPSTNDWSGSSTAKKTRIWPRFISIRTLSVAFQQRAGNLPANLQGIWNDSLTPPWSSDFHLNYQLQMNYWPAEVCNLAECHEPCSIFSNRFCRRRATRRGVCMAARARSRIT